MLRFVAARLVQSLVALAIISVVVFVLARATGDPLYLILPMSASQEDFDNARRYLGLDRPYVEQSLSFVGRAVTGDFGNSLRARRPVSELIRERLPNSLKLAVFAMGVSLAMAFPLGVMAAVRKGTGLDRFAQVVSVLGQSLPTFWVAILLVEFVAGRLQWLPAGGLDGFASYILPRLHPRLVRGGRPHAPAALRHARGARLRVRQARAGEGRRRGAGDLAARAQERPDPGGDLRGHLLRDPGDHRDRGGDRVRVARPRPPRLRGHQLARLPGDPGGGADHRGHRRRHQPVRGLSLRGDRSSHPPRPVGAVAAEPAGGTALALPDVEPRPDRARRSQRLPLFSL